MMDYSNFLTTGNILGLLDVLYRQLEGVCVAAFAPGTAKNLLIQWNTYIGFSRYCGVDWRKPSERFISAYAVYLSKHFKSSSSVKNYISGIKTLFTLMSGPLDIRFS